MSKRHRRTEDWDRETGSNIARDGETVRVRLDMCDAAHQHRRMSLADEIRHDCRIFSGHRPGPIQDGAFAANMSVQDAANLAGAMASRELAFDQLEERSRNAWQNGPPQIVASPEPNYDQRRPPNDINGNGNNGDDDDELTGPPDHNDVDQMEAAMAARDRARLERDRIGDNKWRDMGGTLFAANPTGSVGPMGNYPQGNLSGYRGTNGTLDPNVQPRVQALYERTLGGPFRR
jgi:hypothetical protein